MSISLTILLNTPKASPGTYLTTLKNHRCPSSSHFSIWLPGFSCRRADPLYFILYLPFPHPRTQTQLLFKKIPDHQNNP